MECEITILFKLKIFVALFYTPLTVAYHKVFILFSWIFILIFICNMKGEALISLLPENHFDLYIFIILLFRF